MIRVITVVAGATLAVAGCGDSAAPAAQSTAADVPAASAVADPAGKRACDAVKAAVKTPDQLDPGAMIAISADGAKSTSQAIRDRAKILGDYAKLVGRTSDRNATLQRVATAAEKLEAACTSEGYYG